MIPTCCSILLAYYYCIRSFPYLLWDRKPSPLPPPLLGTKAKNPKQSPFTERKKWHCLEIAGYSCSHWLFLPSCSAHFKLLGMLNLQNHHSTFIQYIYLFSWYSFFHINLPLASWSSSHNSHIYNLLKQFQFLFMGLIIFSRAVLILSFLCLHQPCLWSLGLIFQEPIFRHGLITSPRQEERLLWARSTRRIPSCFACEPLPLHLWLAS